MSQLKNMSIILVIAFAAAILERTEAADRIVGGTTGWAVPGGASFYSDWASNITFKQSDVLVFNFATGGHTVAEVSKANFDNCNGNQNSQILTTGPARVTLNRTGDFYFICTIQGHCANGQKLSVKVSSSSPAPAQGPSPPSPTPPSPTPPTSGTTPTPPTNGGAPPPSSPTGPDATPPSPGSATTIVSTFSILIAVVLNLLF